MKLGMKRKLTRVRFNRFIEKYAFNGPVLDVGGANSPYRRWFPTIKSLDISPDRGADIIGDAHDMHMIPDASYDLVLCTSVLEHCLEPARVLAEIRRVLRVDGRLILSVPFVFPIHDAPHDYWRFTEFGVKRLLTEFEIEEFVEDMNTLETLGYMFHRLFLQTTGALALARALSFLASKLLYLLPKGALGSEYGDGSRRYRMNSSILVADYLVCARKPGEKRAG
ncbi:class I SAM-dependent methyltransferase [Geomonas subterranea]|uniref:Class I SAM-dependent methyltransferase n=1 Tax=Geomonas subterranea TaxID=2847989 RepID=A0ABX8LIJ5_9BACT|nr:class I SAM-dependent methyltransferase [Geomonas subterranea]QXE91558.1 class I SAM-dependent methyltransferase [Geomonas subterranea]QXM10353.1 class I SAM-dependent methyltransferase [Geomonas subterranea]